MTPSKPSDFMRRAAPILRLTITHTRTIARSADAYQREMQPGKPSVTMAAFLWAAEAHATFSKKDVCEAFNINCKSLTARERQMEKQRRR